MINTLFIAFCLFYVLQVESFTTKSISLNSQLSPHSKVLCDKIRSKKQELDTTSNVVQDNKPSAFDTVASKGLAGVLAIAVAEAIFWALGMPLGN
jgi:hypothetical protein